MSSGTDATPVDDIAAAAADPRRWRALALGISALALVLLDLGMTNVLLPPIAETTGADPTQQLWVVSGYALAFGVVPVLGGRLGDDYGRRRLLLIGVGGFVVTSALVGLAPNIEVLIAARILQGLAGGLINPQVSGVVQQVFPLSERGRAFGLIGASVGGFTAAGPAIGGGLVDLGGPDVGWRLCFLINIPIGGAVFLLSPRWWPASGRRRSRRPLDLTGAALLTAALLCALYPTVQFATDHDARLIGILAGATVFAGLFVWWEVGPARRRGHPLIDVALFRIRSFGSGLGVGFLFFCAFNGLGLVLALYLQDGLGLSAGQTGLVVALYALGTAAGALVAGRQVAQHGPRVLLVSLSLFVIAVIAAGTLAATLSGHASTGAVIAALFAPLLLAGIGAGGVVSPNQALTLADLGTLGGATAGAMLQTSQRIGNSIGTAVISAAYFYVVQRPQPASPSGRADQYGKAYGLALLISLLFGLVALALAFADVRRHRPTTSATTIAGLSKESP